MADDLIEERENKLRLLPEKCQHGEPVDYKFLGRSVMENSVWFTPACKDSHKNLRGHAVSSAWPEDTSRVSDRELAMRAPRKTRSDKGTKRVRSA